MSYQVLARQWRPRTFHELVGQEHVSRALVNALDQGRLHHAYLFTGTRGVGKTTLARILARCLNCESGVTSRPCGVCETCRAIDEGRFVDLIEVDAASRTKVEDTRELLDNVQYAPTQGRYKVYLIDEVHMLSTHSFNALLKTLEEPPPHVRFLLATTDPQKLPATVLSRCLQFALKRMTPERIVGHLRHILGHERTPFDEAALWLLGRAADGSMRDGLSLTDQAIAFGHGEVREADVIAMLGTLDQRRILGLAEALARGDAAAVLAEVATLAEQGPDFAGVLDALAGVFHRLAVAQMVPDALDNGEGDREALLELAGRFSAEDVQLYYQIAIAGRGDMDSAPEARTALEMTLLRMLAFRPQGAPAPAPAELPIRASAPPAASSEEASATGGGTGDSAAVSSPDATADGSPAAAPSSQSVAPARFEEPMEAPVEESSAVPPDAQQAPSPAPPWDDDSDASSLPASEESAALAEALVNEGAEPPVADTTEPGLVPEPPADEDTAEAFGMPEPPQADEGMDEKAADSAFEAYFSHAPAAAVDTAALSESPPAGPPPLGSESPPEVAPADAEAEPDDRGPLDNTRWLRLFPRLALSGMTANLVANCVVDSDDGRALTLRLDPSQSAMNADVHRERLAAALEGAGESRRVMIEVNEIDPQLETPARHRERLEQQRRQRAVEALEHDPHIQSLQQTFGARLLERTVTSFEQDSGTDRG
ncbi:DNA polymerase III subunit gamma/tau [Kushneria aurantia]|uniref:DNA polymerase III subunit gamma/tau n=1 Tax=Kushneria aurantia TaxID=504092 RepID=A0ABV6G7N9_9GAMM|nr:DNA polymerase III subunit gamma/tau [Kushneria aurantia]